MGHFGTKLSMEDVKKFMEHQLKFNQILAKDYDRVHQVKIKNLEKKKISTENKIKILLKFVEINKRTPKYKEEYQNIRIGAFWSGVKHGKYKEFLKDILQTNIILSRDYDRIQQVKIKNLDKEKINIENKAKLLIEFVEINKRIPKKEEQYKNIKIGHFWYNIRRIKIIKFII